MPRIRTEASLELTDGVQWLLLDGFWVDGISGEEQQPSDERLRAIWFANRSELLASFKPSKFDSADRPPWAMYHFEMLPEHGPRRGFESDPPDFGFYCRDGDYPNCETWKQYYKRCGVTWPH